MRYRPLPPALAVVLIILLAPLSADGEDISFRRDVAPILLDRCLACHGPKKAEGNYRIDSWDHLMQGGDSEIASFVAGDLEESEAFRRMASDDESERMPLDADPLAEDELELIRTWIEQGAVFDGEDTAAGLASLIPVPTHPEPPPVYSHPMPVTALEFSLDGTELFAAGYHEVTVWDAAEGNLLRRIANVGQRTYALDMHADGILAVGGGFPGRRGEVRLFDSATGELLQVLNSTTDVVLDVQFSPDGTRLATGGADSVVRIYQMPDGALERTITSHSDWVTAVAWSADGLQLATASRDKTAKVFDVETGDLKVTYSGHGDAVKGVAFRPDGQQVYSSGADRKIHRWTIAEGKKEGETGFGGEVFKLLVSDSVLLASSADKTVRQLNAASHEAVRNYAGHQDWAVSIAYHGGSGRIAAGGFNGTVIVWDAETGDAVATYHASPGHDAAGP